MSHRQLLQVRCGQMGNFYDGYHCNFIFLILLVMHLH